MSSEVNELKTKTENNLEERIEVILSKVVGQGKVIAKVDAMINTRDTTAVEESVDPDQTAVKSTQTEEEKLDGSRRNPTGIPGSRANLPGAEENGQVAFNQNVNKEYKITNYEVPKTVKNVKEAPGRIERISVAVLVDGVRGTKSNQDGSVEETWTPRTSEELQKYEALVKSALGFDPKRGDVISVQNIKFEKEDFSESEKLLSSLERRRLVSYLIKWSVIGFAFALFFFLVVRPFMRWVTESFQESVDEILPKTIEELEELQSVDNTLPGMSGALPMLEDSIDPDKAESDLLKERIMSLMEKDQKKAAAALGLWLVRRND
jgi:flagellar M-ring protein FliF